MSVDTWKTEVYLTCIREELCVIPCHVLAAIYDRFGSRLLEGNVRSFLGARGRTNKAIRKTVTLEPTMFFAYNNGIAATASAATVNADATGLRLTHVTDLQIVNGGQTTATLAGAMTDKDDGLSQTFVQMKLSVLPAETSGKYIPLIARYANSQNRVSDADFFSNHEFHRRMEQIAKALRAPAVGGAQYGTHWLYESCTWTARSRWIMPSIIWCRKSEADWTTDVRPPVIRLAPESPHAISCSPHACRQDTVGPALSRFPLGVPHYPDRDRALLGSFRYHSGS